MILLMLFICMGNQALAEDFQKIIENGFGNINNRYAWAMAEFTPDTGPDQGEKFLYVGTRNEAYSDAGEVHRMDIDNGVWEVVNTDGFGDKSNKGIRTLTVFENEYGKALYAGTFNLLRGAEVFRTYDGMNWEAVNRPGFATFSLGGAGSIRGAAVINGDLYYGTSNDIWGLPTHPYMFRFREKRGRTGNLNKKSSWQAVITSSAGFASGQKTYADIIQFTDKHDVTKIYTTTWNALDGAYIIASESGDKGTWQPVMDDGFGRGITGILSIIEFKGYLYAGTGDPDIGFSLYRSNDPLNPASWEQIGLDGFGYGALSYYAWSMVEKDGVLYLGTYNPPNTALPQQYRGAFLYKSEDGVSWQQIVGPNGTADMDGGFDDPLNVGIRNMVTIDNKVYIGTASSPSVTDEINHGLEIWEMQ